MSEITIKVNTEDAKSIKAAVALLMLLGATPDSAIDTLTTGITASANEVVVDDDLDLSDLGDSEEEEPEDDMLGDILDDEEEEDPGVSVEDMKAAFKELITKRGKDIGTAFVKEVLGKLKVKGMSDIPDETREKFVKVLNQKATSKK